MPIPAAMRAKPVVAAGASLLAALFLAACGADDEPANRSATATTAAAPAATSTAVAAAPLAATPAATTTTTTTTAADSTAALTADTAVTPGVTGQGTTNAQDATCANAAGVQQQVIGSNAAATLTTPAATTTTTTPTATTTTPVDPSATDLDAVPAATATTPPIVPTTEALQTTTSDTANGVTADQALLARPFSRTSPWNTPIDTRVVDSRSREWIDRASRRIAVVTSENRRSVTTTEREAPDLRLYVNTCAWTPTIVGEDDGETVRIVCRQRNCGEVAKQIKTLRVPRGVDPFPEFDGWYSVIDESARVGYDMWRARRVGDVISYQFIKRWALDGPGFSPPATEDASAAVGARGSGLPLFAGVIQPSELRQGRIDHALAISVPGPAQRIFVQPASVTNGINLTTSLPEGARLRLSSSWQLGRLPRGANRRSAEAIVTALRTYGAIVVDRSITPTLYARRSTNYGTLLLGTELRSLRLSDLEVVLSPALLRFPPLEVTPEAIQG
jgi:hypothetical protein